MFCVMPRCYYEVLGVEATATPEEIKKAYYKRSLLVHPDRRQDKEAATVEFQELLRAYEFITSPQERAWYDRHKSVFTQNCDGLSPENPSKVIPEVFLRARASERESFYNCLFSLLSQIFCEEADSDRGWMKMVDQYLDASANSSGIVSFHKTARNITSAARNIVASGLPSDLVEENIDVKYNSEKNSTYKDETTFDSNISHPINENKNDIINQTKIDSLNEKEDLNKDIEVIEKDLSSEDPNFWLNKDIPQEKKSEESIPEEKLVQTSKDDEYKNTRAYHLLVLAAKDPNISEEHLNAIYAFWATFRTTRKFHFPGYMMEAPESADRQGKRYVEHKNLKIERAWSQHWNTRVQSTIRLLRIRDPRKADFRAKERSDRPDALNNLTRSQILLRRGAVEKRLKELEISMTKIGNEKNISEEAFKAVNEQTYVPSDSEGEVDVEASRYDFRKSELLIQQERIITNKTDDSECSNDSNENIELAFSCFLCQKNFASQNTLQQHFSSKKHQAAMIQFTSGGDK